MQGLLFPPASTWPRSGMSPPTATLCFIPPCSDRHARAPQQPPAPHASPEAGGGEGLTPVTFTTNTAPPTQPRSRTRGGCGDGWQGARDRWGTPQPLDYHLWVWDHEAPLPLQRLRVVLWDRYVSAHHNMYIMYERCSWFRGMSRMPTTHINYLEVISWNLCN
jgi:hypothetical protein